MRPRIEAEDEKDEIKAEVEREKKPAATFSPFASYNVLRFTCPYFNTSSNRLHRCNVLPLLRLSKQLFRTSYDVVGANE